MKWIRAIAIVLAFLQLAVASFGAEERPPNIVFILADDLGWSELGCYGNDFNETPHLDRLSQQGMRFEQAYAAAPVCSPYRAALLTGQYPARVGIVDYLRPNSAAGLSLEHVTLAEMLRQNGYSTGMIGKWHLTGYRHHGAEHEVRPVDHGFSWDFAAEVKGVGNGANFWPYVFRNQSIRWLDIDEKRFDRNEYLVDRMSAEAVEFIENNKQRPFFLYLSHYATHTILNGKKTFVEKYRKKHKPGNSTRTKCYLCEDAGAKGDSLNHWAGDHNPHLAAMLESIDDGVGAITSKLDELGLADNTMIVFTSDNGGETNVTSNAPLRGGKSQLYEGGIRVPLIVRWPGEIPAGSRCKQPTANYDFYPTMLAAAGIEPNAKQTLDGLSILPTLRDPAVQPKRDALYWHYPLDRPHFLGGTSSGAIRSGAWKLIEHFETDDVELFNLQDDIGEKSNLARERPRQVKELREKLVAWRESVGARTPSSPLMSDAKSLYFGDAFSPGQISERWFFQKEWAVDKGVLVRNDIPGENKRIFIKNPKYRDVMIRFDFRLQGAREIRLMTGTPGHYNVVVHVRTDRFFVQTARDESVPFYPSFQGECIFEFATDRWYTMTVEICGDEVVAHVDRNHFALAQHPIVDRQRGYFAFQVDRPSAAFDNVQIFKASRKKDWPQKRTELAKIQAARPAIPKPPAEQFQFLQMNLRDRLYRTDAKYRELVARIDQLKEKERTLFPDVFASFKDERKKIDKYRRNLLKTNAGYKELRDQINRTKRSQRDFLHAQNPTLDKLPPSQYAVALERARSGQKKNAEFLQLSADLAKLEDVLSQRFPKLFVTDRQILEKHRKARRRRSNEDRFKAQLKATGDAVRAEKDYLFSRDPDLKRLHVLVFGS